MKLRRYVTMQTVQLERVTLRIARIQLLKYDRNTFSLVSPKQLKFSGGLKIRLRRALSSKTLGEKTFQTGEKCGPVVSAHNPRRVRALKVVR